MSNAWLWLIGGAVFLAAQNKHTEPPAGVDIKSAVLTDKEVSPYRANAILNAENATKALSIGNQILESMPHVTLNTQSYATGYGENGEGQLSTYNGVNTYGGAPVDLASPQGVVAPASVNLTGERFSSQFSTAGISNDEWKAAGFTFSGEGTLNMNQASWKKSSIMAVRADLVTEYELLGGQWQLVASPESTAWNVVYW